MTAKQFLHVIGIRPYKRTIGFYYKDEIFYIITIEENKEYVDGTFEYENWEVTCLNEPYNTSDNTYTIGIRKPNTTRDGMKNEAIKIMNKRFVELAYEVKKARESNEKCLNKVIDKCRMIADELETLQKAIDIL